MIGCVNCELGTGSPAEFTATFDVTVCVGSNSADLDMSPNVCRGMRGNPMVAFGSAFESICMGLTAGISLLGLLSPPHAPSAEPIERIELMAIAAVEVGSNIQRKLLEDLEKEKDELIEF
jgi:hypothetical protein